MIERQIERSSRRRLDSESDDGTIDTVDAYCGRHGVQERSKRRGLKVAISGPSIELPLMF